MDGMQYIFTFSGKNDQETVCTHGTKIVISQSSNELTAKIKSKQTALNG